MTVEIAQYPEKTTKEYRPTYATDRPFVNEEHAAIYDLVSSIKGKMWPEDAFKLYEMAYFAEGPILEIGCFHGKSTTIMARAIQAAGRDVPLVSIDINSEYCEIAETHVKRFAPETSVQFHVGKSADLLRRLDLDPAFVFVDGDPSYEGVKADLQNLIGKVRDRGFLLLHGFFDSHDDDPNEPHYGVSQAAQEVLDSSLFSFSGRFGYTALFQKTAVESTPDTYQLSTADALGSLQSAPANEALLQAVVTALVNHLSLPDYGIDWNEDRCVIPEIWMLDPRRRFRYFAHLSIYDFACRFAEGKRVLDVGGGVGYGGYYLVTRGAQEVWSLDVDERAYRYGRDRYQDHQLRFFLGPIESLVGQFCDPFDFIICSHGMEHIADYDNALASIDTLLAPGGRYLQVDPRFDHSRGILHRNATPSSVPQWGEILEPLFPRPRYFAQIPVRSKTETLNQFDFRFEEGSPYEMHRPDSTGGLILCEKPAVSSPTAGRLSQTAAHSIFENRTGLKRVGRVGIPTPPSRAGKLTPQRDQRPRDWPSISVPNSSRGENPAGKLGGGDAVKTDIPLAAPKEKSIRQLQIENEHFVPLLGLELEPYLETENKNGIHHLGRYLWAVNVLRQRRPKRVLDIACGAGYGSYLLARDVAGTTVVGADYDSAAVDHAQGTYHHENLHYAPGDVTQWNLGEFDAIISFDTIEHVRHREIMLQNFVEHLSPDGCLLLSTPVRSKMILNPDWEHHAIEYTSEALLNFLRRYFTRVHRPEDGTLPCVGFFDRINGDRPRYKLTTNPLVCEGPIRL